jgi:hypothetical protein
MYKSWSIALSEQREFKAFGEILFMDYLPTLSVTRTVWRRIVRVTEK